MANPFGKIGRALKATRKAVSGAATSSTTGRAVTRIGKDVRTLIAIERRGLTALGKEAYRTSPQRVVQNNVFLAKEIGKRSVAASRAFVDPSLSRGTPISSPPIDAISQLAPRRIRRIRRIRRRTGQRTPDQDLRSQR